MYEELKTEAPKKRIVLRPTAGIPVLLSLTFCVLIIVLILSGTKPGIFEDYRLLAVLCHQLIPPDIY
jgi:hypothetical protein